jgi:hypothetical protein
MFPGSDGIYSTHFFILSLVEESKKFKNEKKGKRYHG